MPASSNSVPSVVSVIGPDASLAELIEKQKITGR